MTDFLALEVSEGKLKYYLNFGDTTQIGLLQKVNKFSEKLLALTIYHNHNIT